MFSISDDTGVVCELDDTWNTSADRWERALDRRHALIEDQLYSWRSWRFVYHPDGDLRFAPANREAKLGDVPVLACGPAECREMPYVELCIESRRDHPNETSPAVDCRCGVHSIYDLRDLRTVQAMPDVTGPGIIDGARQGIAWCLVVPFGKLGRGRYYDPTSTVRSEYVICFGAILPNDATDYATGALPVLGYGNVNELHPTGDDSRELRYRGFDGRQEGR